MAGTLYSRRVNLYGARVNLFYRRVDLLDPRVNPLVRATDLFWRKPNLFTWGEAIRPSGYGPSCRGALCPSVAAQK